MLSLVLRRAHAQRRLVATILVLIAVAATLMGVCALLLGPTQDRAFSRQVQRTQPDDVEVDAFLADLSSEDLPAVRHLVTDQLRALLGSLDPGVDVTAISQMRELDELGTAPGREGGGAVGDAPPTGYLAAGSGIAPQVELVTGRWPRPSTSATETAVPEAAARRLHLDIGDQVTLGQAHGVVGRLDPTTVVVVGMFRARPSVEWDGDLLSGAGFDPAYRDGSTTSAAYGPFVVEDAAFDASGSPVARLRVTARPDLALADRRSVGAAVAALDGATERLRSRVGDRSQIVLVKSSLPATLRSIDAHELAGRSTVLVAVLLGAALSLAATLLAARLVAGVRDEERVLLVALGTSARQQLLAAGIEAALVTAVAAAVALPAAALLHSWLTHAAGPAAAGLAQSPTVTVGLLLAVAGSALVLAPVLVATALDTASTSLATRRRWALARAGADLTMLALAVAVAGFSLRELRSQSSTDATGGDLALTLAPAICLLSTLTVVVRLSPMLLRVGGHLALRSRALVLPLSTQLAARRPHSVTAMVLVAASVGTATFGLGLRATWERSQADQAALRVGTDLRLRLPTAASAQTASDLVAARGAANIASARSAVIVRPLTIGNLGGASSGSPMLIGIDSRVAGSLLRGRSESDASWGVVGHRLDPDSPVTGPVLGTGAMLRGRVTGPVLVSATAIAVVQDEVGVRRPLRAPPVPLDGHDHAVLWPVPAGSSLHVVALSMHLTGPPGGTENDAGAAGEDVETTGVTAVTTLMLPTAGSSASTGVEWHGQSEGATGAKSTVTVRPVAGDRLRLQATTYTDTGHLTTGGSDLLTTTFPAPDEVPVAVSKALADSVGTKAGGKLTGSVDGTPLPLRVVAVVPSVPSQPGGLAVLADADTVSRRLVAAGRLEPVVNELWIARPSELAERTLRQHRLGEITTREQVTEELSGGPLQVTVPTMLTVLMVAATMLLLVAVALITGADQRGRAVELTRLRALGLPRRGSRRLLLFEHATYLAPLVLVGVLVGAAACVVLGPLMIRSDIGTRPVPAPVASWPWPAELLLIAVILFGSTTLTWVAAVLHVRASDVTGLRMGDQ